MLLSATQDGEIQVYSTTHARAAQKMAPTLDRSNRRAESIQLLRTSAVTLDRAKR